MAATSITVYSDDLQDAVNSQVQQPPTIGGSNLYTATFRLTLSSEASGTNFAVAILPKGARIISGVLAASATLANSATLAVGLAATDGTGVIDPATNVAYRADGSTVATYKTDGTAITAGTALSDSTTCLKAGAVQSTTQVGFALTMALGYTYQLAKECYLTLTSGAGTVSTEVVMGHIVYAMP